MHICYIYSDIDDDDDSFGTTSSRMRGVCLWWVDADTLWHTNDSFSFNETVTTIAAIGSLSTRSFANLSTRRSS